RITVRYQADISAVTRDADGVAWLTLLLPIWMTTVLGVGRETMSVVPESRRDKASGAVRLPVTPRVRKPRTVSPRYSN
ncbi:MAG: hypothetical protein J0I73_07950, partial [Sphingomonas sp.]